MLSADSKLRFTLFRGFPGTGHYTWSPFVTKLEARMRFAGISYRTESGSPRTAPRGKIPYLTIESDDNQPPQTVSDSALIIKGFVENGIVEDLNAQLSPAEKAQDLALRALLEDRLYFLQAYEKWVQNFYAQRDHLFAAMPYPMRVIIGYLVYRKMTQTLYGQGTMRFSPEEISSFRDEIWANLNGLLTTAKLQRSGKDDKEKPFWVLGGDNPTDADSVLFGFIVGALICCS
ncbi:glutathione S-transferase [Penicillium riverlandense]|uniref:glutathione S-transferase n=1 Tax=Penicillium riverlandense TaxID=1903569 RepID=UPI002549B719|nr:glutathione S-transferase [Penicillium riverlandense]KAJ5826383.1 glutathione S-transferase [Penicillium riverlandense]